MFKVSNDDNKDDNIATVAAFRTAVQEGWSLTAHIGSIEDVAAEIQRLTENVVEVKEVYRYRYEDRRRLMPYSRTKVRECGWVYDWPADCWRAPGETLKSPEGKPIKAGQLEVSTELFEDGWWRLILSAAGRRLVFNCFELSERPLAILEWCGRLATGGSGALLFTDRESPWDLVAYPLDQDRVRLTVALPSDSRHLRGGRQSKLELDIFLPRKLLVAAFYEGLRTLTKDAGLFRKAWHEAECLTPEVEYAISIEGQKVEFGSCPTCLHSAPDYRSKTIDAFLK